MASVRAINKTLRSVNKGIEHHLRRLPPSIPSPPRIDWFMLAGIVVMLVTGSFILFYLWR